MKTPRPWIIVAVIAVVAVPVGWYLISPLFTTRAVNEDLPSPAVSFNGSQATEAMGTAMAESGDALNEAMPGEMSDLVVMYQGQFYSVVHEGQGVAKLYQRTDGSRFLRLEDFQVLNGPDLHVWLVPVDPVPNTVGTEIAGHYDLGPLKGNVGNQNYDVPADLDLSAFKSIVIWCNPFRAPFSAAPMGST